MKSPTISLAADGFLLDLGGWQVQIPESLEGLQQLKRMLIAREQRKATIGMEGAPTQSMVDAWLKLNKVRRDDCPEITVEIDL